MHIILAFGGHSSSLQTFLFILVCIGKKEHLEKAQRHAASQGLPGMALVLQFGLPLTASQASLPEEIVLTMEIFLDSDYG